MSWHFSRALEEASSGVICSGGDASAPLSATPTHGTCWLPGKTTDVCRPSRSGMTYAPSTGGRGEAALMWCLEDSRARILVLRERALGLPVRDLGSGEKWPESSGRYDPASRSWKTRQCSLLGGLESCSEIWPRWGTMRGGEWWERTTPVLRTSATVSGLWPTPCLPGNGGSHGKAKMREMLYPTPTTEGIDGGSNSRKAAKARGMWPTATARDWNGANAEQGLTRKDGKSRMDQLANAVAWPTPNASDHIQRNTSALWKEKGRVNYVLSNPEVTGVHGGQLNPTWVEWLMGWPLGWTDCAASATDRYLQWRASHGAC